jgi:hypothetical protein
MTRAHSVVLAIVVGLFAGVAMVGQAQAGLGAVVVVSQTSDSDSKRTKAARVECGLNDLAGGGAKIRRGASDVALIATRPVSNTGWTAKATEVNPTNEDWSIQVFAVCLDT